MPTAATTTAIMRAGIISFDVTAFNKASWHASMTRMRERIERLGAVIRTEYRAASFSASIGDMSPADGDMSPNVERPRCSFVGHAANNDVPLDSRYNLRYSSLVGSEPTQASKTEGTATMPRRLDPKPCACGCGEITKSGEFMRGHHTRRRWQLVKAVAAGAEQGAIAGMGNMGARPAGDELARRGWSLPDTYRHFGVELEVIARDVSHVAEAMRAAGVVFGTGGYHARGGRGQWMLTEDSSVVANPAQRARGLYKGLEVVSPPLRGRKGLAEVRRVMMALDAAGIEVNKSCGGHVHHSARDFSVETFKTFVNNYNNLQRAIDGVLPTSRRSTAGNTYCKPWDAYGTGRINDAVDVAEIARIGDRYRVVNLQSYASYGTVELRQHQGTVNADKLINWILLGQGLMTAAKKGFAILPTASLADACIALGMRPAVAEFFAARQTELRAA